MPEDRGEGFAAGPEGEVGSSGQAAGEGSSRGRTAVPAEGIPGKAGCRSVATAAGAVSGAGGTPGGTAGLQLRDGGARGAEGGRGCPRRAGSRRGRKVGGFWASSERGRVSTGTKRGGTQKRLCFTARNRGFAVSASESAASDVTLPQRLLKQRVLRPARLRFNGREVQGTVNNCSALPPPLLSALRALSALTATGARIHRTPRAGPGHPRARASGRRSRGGRGWSPPVPTAAGGRQCPEDSAVPAPPHRPWGEAAGAVPPPPYA